MTPENRKRVVLLILLGVLSFTVAQAYRNTRTPATVAETVVPSEVSDLPAANDGRIRLDLINKDKPESVGESNLFEYRNGQSSKGGSGASPGPVSPVFQPPPMSQPPAVMRPPSPPPPPPISLKYQGFAVVHDGTLTAFLSDETQRYNVKAGEVIMGRFRINRITTESVEVEDLEFKRRQTLPRLH